MRVRVLLPFAAAAWAWVVIYRCWSMYIPKCLRDQVDWMSVVECISTSGRRRRSSSVLGAALLVLWKKCIRPLLEKSYGRLSS